MPITGNQKALMYSLSGVLRAGAGRSGYFRAIAALSIAGVSVTGRGVKPSITISDELNDSPNTATATVRGTASFTPMKGQEILIGLGNLTNRIFAGHIFSAVQRQPRRNAKWPLFELDCIDYSWQLDWKRVTGKAWTNTAIGTIVVELIAAHAPAFTVRVEAGLTNVDFQSNHDERVSSALSRLMGMVGGYWYVDYDRVVHAAVNPEPDANSTALTSTNTNFWNFRYAEDISQTRTRVRVTGGASTTTAVAAVGATSLAIDDTRLFGSSGGYALVGANQITYTGKSVTQGPGTLTGIPASSSGSILVAIAQGESVRVLAISEDATAAAALATLIGTGDGYVEHSFEDGQLGDPAARQAGAGDLILNKSPDKRITYDTHDLFAKSGKVITVDLTNAETAQQITGSFQIQRVVISDLELSMARYPTRTVEAGANRQNIYVLLGTLLES